jgi:hypothetical protein
MPEERLATRLIVIALTASALLSVSGAIAQTTGDKSLQQKEEIEHPGWYEEKVPYRPCPAVATINGRNVCLGCPDKRCQPPPFGPTGNKGDKTAEYREKAPYRPCPTVAAINGRNVCLGCPGRCPGLPSFGK